MMSRENQEKQVQEQQIKASSSDDTIAINFSSLGKQMVSFLEKYSLVFLILISLLLSVYIRMAPVYLPLAYDLARGNVDASIKSLIAGKVQEQYPQLPEANKQQLVEQGFAEVKAKGEFNFNNQQYNIDELTKQTAEELRKNFQNEDGHTYLLDIDTYYFSGQARNYVEHGFEEDVEVDGKYYSTLTIGGLPFEKRSGTTEKIGQFHTLFQVFVYKVMNIFMDASIFQASYYSQLIIAALAVIPAFFIGRRIAGPFSGFFAALIVAMHPSFLPRTLAGVSDTDGYNVFFPLLIMWFFLEALEAKDIKKTAFWSILAGAVTGLFSFAWGGWWFIFDFVLIVSITFFLYELLKIAFDKWKNRTKDVKENIRALKPALLCFILYLVVSGVSTALLRSPADFFGTFSEPLKFKAIKDVGTTKIWPNVLTTVAELNEVSLDQLINEISLHNPLLFFMALLGIVFTLIKIKDIADEELQPITFTLLYFMVLLLFFKEADFFFFLLFTCIPLAYLLFVKKKATMHILFFILTFMLYALIIQQVVFFNGKSLLLLALLFLPLAIGMGYTLVKKQEADMQAALLVGIWFLSTLFASTKGIRFLLLLVPAFALGAGVGLGTIISFISSVMSSLFHLNKKYLTLTFMFFSLFLLLAPTQSAYDLAKHQLPLMNDQWYNALTKIKDNSKENAIITSWWDFGHWFKYVAQRPVTFDGGSQDTPMAHWVGKALLTDNEQQAVGILRMLDCGSTIAFDELNNITQNDLQTIHMLYDLFVLDKKQADAYLRTNNIPEDKIPLLLQYTHCQPPEGYFITSADMVGKAGVWAHFGSWNFTKAAIVNIVNNHSPLESLQEIAALGYSNDEAQRLYDEVKGLGVAKDANNWIASWPSYYTGASNCQQTENETLICSNGIVYNLTSHEFKLYTTNGPTPYVSYAYLGIDNETFWSGENASAVTPDGVKVSATLYPENGSYYGILQDPVLTRSMFNRLFFMKGIGLHCFDLFEYQKTVSNENIFVWKIDWDCSSANTS